ncbi:Oidioi.mRNA.OKI2018_I69.chr2.g6335.t1.cds [Oikopleura dioica]|uniref:Oidioi.mRNA.OKI2018_I69.chr2.g6335.t1.cds n=1 Tax=Oikopleura dioica TaxID=34765 RepID=A0ABN7T6B8_OIKDI|nr:Oidioi.mRNA.OKI2018_I69.chr2.g6335.t1.cds [Oikopleura dioica]
MPSIDDPEALSAAVAGMEDDPELMAAYAEAQAELANMMPKSKKKKKKKNKKGQLGAEVAELENLIKQLEGADDIVAADAALEALKMSEPKKKSKKKKKQQLEPEMPTEEELLNAEDLQDLPQEVLDELRNYEPTEEEIAAEFERLKAEKEQKKKKKMKKKKEEQLFDLGVDDETGEALRMDDPELLRELIDQEEDPMMKKHLQKLLKKTKKKKIKKEKVENRDIGEFDDRAFHDSGDFGWSQKEIAKKVYVPTADENVDAMDTSELHETEALIPGTEDFGPALPETGIAPRPEAGAIPGGSKLKPVLDDEEVEKRLRQKAMEKAIQERLDKRMMRAKKIEVKMAKWISTQRSLKDEAKQLTEDRIKRAEVINEIIAPGVAKKNEEEIANRKDIVSQIRERLRKEITDEVRKEIEDEEDRIQRKYEKAPEAPKVSAAVMDAIQMSDAWESFWRRYKSQLQDWKQWSDEQEEYHKQAAGWYFTQGFIQSQVANNVPAAPDEDPNNAVADPDVEQAGPLLPGQTSVEEEKPRENPDDPPPPPTHRPEDEADDEEEAKLDEFQRKLRRRKEKKLEKYEALLNDPIFSGKKGSEDDALGSEGRRSANGTRMLNTVRGPRAIQSSTVGTNFLPTQDDALQFIKLERFRRDRHRFKSSDLDSDETESEDESAEKRQRGSRLPPWMAKATETMDPKTLTTTVMNASATNINQPGEMINPAGEEVQISSSSESEEDEERAERRRAMAAKFNPNAIYGESTISAAPDIKKPAARKSERVKEWSMYGTAANAQDSDIRAEEGDTFSFDFSAKPNEETSTEATIAAKKKLFGRKGETPKYLPEEGGPGQGVGIHKEGPLKGLPKHWQQQTGLRQRPRETYEQQFVEVSEDHLPPTQRELPEFVQDLPDENAVLDAANMAVRDYQKQQLYQQSGKTKMEQYLKRRAEDTRFAVEGVKKPDKKEEDNVVLEEENLEFDPSAFFGDTGTGGLFSGTKDTVAKKDEKPKRSKYAGGFGSTWKKKKEETKKIELNLNSEAAQALAGEEEKKEEKTEKEKEDLPSFLKEPVFEKDDSEEFGWGEGNQNRRKGTKAKKRKDVDGEVLGEEKKKKKSKKFDASWMKRVGEDPDKPLKEQSYDVDESELRTYDSANKKAESETTRQDAGDREDRDWGAWKPRSRQVKVPEEKEKQVRKYKEGEISELHKKLLDPARFDYDPDFARAGSLQFMHPLQCSKVLGRPYPEDLASKGQVAFDDDIVAYREPKAFVDPAELGPEAPPDGAIFWGIPEEVETAPRLVVLKTGIPENCPGPEPRGWLDGLKRRKWYEKANQPEIRPVHPASYFKKGEQLHQDKTFGVFYHPKYYGKTKSQKQLEAQQSQSMAVDEARESLRQSFKV